MTHSGGKPHTNVGDCGQRYEIRARFDGKKEHDVIGWSTTLDGADQMASIIRLKPGCTSTTIFDREQNKPVITSYAGILR
jgi:hypothetical protein